MIENLIKRKWSAIILRHFESGISSPTEISSREPDISAFAMNERLRTMHRYSLITRTPAWLEARSPSYRLTPRGLKMLRVLTVIEHFDQVEDIVIQTNEAGLLVVRSQI